MPIKAVLFDLDETLMVDALAFEAAVTATCEQAIADQLLPAHVDTSQAVHDVLDVAGSAWAAGPDSAYCRSIGISATEGLWAKFDSSGEDIARLRIWAPTYRRDVWTRALARQDVDASAQADALSAILSRERRARHTNYPDAEACLATLQGSYALGLVTNGCSDLQREKLQASGLESYFSTIAISGERGAGKPDPRLFEDVLARLGVQADQAVMVGDKSERDVAGALNAGITAIRIDRGIGIADDDAFPPRDVITNLSTFRVLLHDLEHV